MSIRTVELPEITMAYRDSGPTDGHPVLLLHGGASSSATWDRLTPALVAEGLRVLAPDLRGHGGSGRTARYPLTGYRDDVLGLVDALGLTRVALVGHSLGGHVAGLIAQARPELVTRLVLEDAPTRPRTPDAADRLSSTRLVLLGLVGLFARRGYHHAALASAIRQLRTPDPEWWRRLSSITAPTLVISGGAGSHIAPAGLAEMARAVPDCRLITVDVGHRVHSLAPAAFRDAVVPFLAGRGADDGAVDFQRGDRGGGGETRSSARSGPCDDQDLGR